MPGRIQSPSSINTYRQCPSKYYYQYIEELPTKPSIHLVRGHVVHEVLENFFHLDTSDLSRANYEMALKKRIQDLLLKHWQEEKDFSKLDLTKEKLMFYFDESMLMLLTPTTEQQYVSEEHKVQGFIDAIEDIDDHVRIIDYKTSKSFDISEEY